MFDRFHEISYFCLPFSVFLSIKKRYLNQPTILKPFFEIWFTEIATLGLHTAR